MLSVDAGFLVFRPDGFRDAGVSAAILQRRRAGRK
jgi:hypothetical protein